jgi:hypothetical protein
MMKNCKKIAHRARFKPALHFFMIIIVFQSPSLEKMAGIAALQI